MQKQDPYTKLYTLYSKGPENQNQSGWHLGMLWHPISVQQHPCIWKHAASQQLNSRQSRCVNSTLLHFNIKVLCVPGRISRTDFKHCYGIIANIFMEHLEKRILKGAFLKPCKWFQYVDDTFVIWSHGHNTHSSFLYCINFNNPFTMETEIIVSVSFPPLYRKYYRSYCQMPEERRDQNHIPSTEERRKVLIFPKDPHPRLSSMQGYIKSLIHAVKCTLVKLGRTWTHTATNTIGVSD